MGPAGPPVTPPLDGFTDPLPTVGVGASPPMVVAVGSSDFVVPHACQQPVHTMLMPPPGNPPLRCRPMGENPIYEQLRGERINADVPATEADPQGVAHPGQHCLLAEGTDATAVTGPPGPGADVTANLSESVGSSAVDQLTDDGQRPGAALWGPRAALPPAAHAHGRHASADDAGYHPPARDALAGARGAHRG
jgi:hypothetical protein